MVRHLSIKEMDNKKWDNYQNSFYDQQLYNYSE